MSGLRRWLFVIAGMAALVVLLLGVVAGEPPAPVPRSTPSAAGPSEALPSPGATAGPVAVAPDRDRIWVYFARDQLPPLGAYIRGIFQDDGRPESRIQSRIGELQRARADAVPAGAMNLIPLIGRFEQTATGSRGSSEIGVRADGDLARVEFGAGHFDRIRGAAMTQALLQQLVYTVTEEPGIRRVLLTERDGGRLTIDQLVVDKPLTREDVAGYGSRGSLAPLEMLGAAPPATLTTSASVDVVAPGMARFVVTLGGPEVAPPARIVPTFSVGVLGTTGGLPGKYELDVTIPRATDSGTNDTTVDQSPLRWYMLGRGSGVPDVTYRLGLDDLRPWRAVVLQDPTRIAIDVGGPPRALSDGGDTAIYSPAPGAEVGRTFRVSGAVRAFEAGYVWRVRNATDAVVANGFSKATIGTSLVWGGYGFEVSLPASVSGSVTLEVFQVSPKDGSEIAKVTIPLTVR